MERIPDRMYIAKGDRMFYDKLEEEWIFKNKTKKEQFMLAMAVGYKNKLRHSFDKREEFFFIKDLNEKDEAILRLASNASLV